MGKEDFNRPIELFQFTGDLESLRDAFPYALEKYGDIKDAWAVQLHKPPSFYMDMLNDNNRQNWSNFRKLFNQDLSPTLIFLPNPDNSGKHLAILLDRQEDSSGNIDLNSPINLTDYPPDRIHRQLDDLLNGEGGMLSNGADQDIEYLDVHLLPLSIEQEEQYISHDACSNQNEYSLTAEASQEMIRAILGLANFENNPNKDMLLVPEKDRVDPASYAVLLESTDKLEAIKIKPQLVFVLSMFALLQFGSAESGQLNETLQRVLHLASTITGLSSLAIGLDYMFNKISSLNIIRKHGK